MSLSRIVSDILRVKQRRDLEIWVRGRSRSLKMVPFKSLDTVFYSHSIVTAAVSVAVSTQYTNVTDTRRTDTARPHRWRLGTASCGKKDCSYFLAPATVGEVFILVDFVCHDDTMIRETIKSIVMKFSQ